MKLAKILILVRRQIDYVFKVMRSKVKVTETFAGGGIQIGGSPSKTIWILMVT